MAKQIVVALVLLPLLLATSSATAQDEPDPATRQDGEEEVFNLIVGEDVAEEEAEEEVEAVYEPRIEPGRWGVSLTLGYQTVSGTMFEHPNLIYKVDDEAFYYADVSVDGESAFNPILRGMYNLTTWFALEGQLGVSFAEYTADISDPFSIDPEGGTPAEVEELGEFDLENRSTLIATGNVNGVFYPFNLDGDGRGRWHPYLTGGVGYVVYNMDSDWIDDPASAINVNLGAGLQVIADDIISVRLEALYSLHTIEFEPGQFFQERDEGTVKIPVYDFDDLGNYGPVSEYGSNTLSAISVQLGFVLGL
jgi:hypothetical protein